MLLKSNFNTPTTATITASNVGAINLENIYIRKSLYGTRCKQLFFLSILRPAKTDLIHGP